MRKITQNDIRTINELYLKLRTYAAVSRETGFAPSTIKKYIIQDYKPIEERSIKRFNKPLPEKVDFSIFYCDDWGNLCELNDEEYKGVKELWAELEM